MAPRSRKSLRSRHDPRAAATLAITSPERAKIPYANEPPRMSRAHITRFRELLDGIEQALVGSVTDEQHMLSRARIEELRGRVVAIDLDESWGADATNAVQEALVYIDHLRAIADEALAEDADILLG